MLGEASALPCWSSLRSWASGSVLLSGHGQQRVTAQEVVVVEVLITQRQAVNPLGDQFLDRMLDEQWVAVITKAGGQLAAEAQALVDLAQSSAPPSLER